MAMRVFNVGDVLAAADVNEYLVNTRFAIKPADTSRSANTTLTADPDLTLTADANKSYLLQMIVNHYNGGGSTANLKLSLTVPASANFYGGSFGAAVGGTFGSSAWDAAATGLPLVGTAAYGDTIGDQPILFTGVLVTGASAGSVTFNWAQNASSATAETVRAGSWMLLRRVA